ncbi:MAG: hypothetical protein KF862_27605 [Chitinophagaceae bacterium]|nr:hypothetical protein [Chitinophagaceae bacterium]
MTKFKKIIIRTCFVFIILIPVAAFAHFIVFPQETRSILIDYSNFKKEGRIYFNASTPHSKIDSLKSLITRASIRIDSFWGEEMNSSKFIYCDNEDDFKKYCVNPSAPAVTYLKLGSVIVLSAEVMNTDIIAHELSHAELYERIGFYTFNYKIPSWFKHGLAMQNDYRDYYSEDTLKVKSNNFKNLPDIKSFTSDKQFYAGSLQQIMLNYMAAKHEIKNWYTKDKLDNFLTNISSGKTFEEAFGQ